MKHKKRALFNSLISLLLCISMLVGTTFAWFTDAVTTGINMIAAGVLDVELYHSNAVVTDEEVDSNTKLFMDLQGNPILWEPGVVSYENLRVNNAGDLALAYQLTINTDKENYVVDPSGAQYGLSQILKVGVVEGGITATDRAGVVASVDAGSWTTMADFLRNGSLLPEGTGTSQETWGVVVYWEPGDNDNLWNLNNGKQLNEGEVLQIDLGISLIATQEQHEEDSFGSDYDGEAKAAVFPDFVGGSASADVDVDDQNRTTAQANMASGAVAATVPAGVLVESGVKELKLNVSSMSGSGANITLDENEDMISLDVHIEGVAADNTVPITVTLKEAAPIGLNMGNYKLYHVENGTTNEMTLVDSTADFSAHNQFKYDPVTGDIVLYMATFSEVTVVADLVNPWNGEFSYDWYSADADTLTIANADELAGFGAIVGGTAAGIDQDTFSGKTVKLISDINLGDDEEHNNTKVIFYPIGYYNSEGTYERTNTAITSGLRNFEGTFDGNGHTIANFYQNTWEMKGDHNWYTPEEQYYRDGMGLFGKVYSGTVKNLTVANFSSDGEIATTGVIAAYADGATFENIAIFNCNPRVYNIGNGGIVGCVGWYAKEADVKTTFTNITVDNSNKISALWGSYDVACGGIVGQYYPTSGQTSAGTPKNAGIEFVNCHVSAIMDVYNDVCANYQYYAYRYTGMLIGSVRENETIDGHVYPKMDGITASGCTVHFGTWNDYYYCEIVDNTTASYTHDYQMSRLTEIKAIDGTTITYLDGTTGTVPASGRANYVIVDYTKGHGTENATCYHFKDGEVWNHEDGGYHNGTDGGKIIDENGDGNPDLREDKQHIYLEFNNLVTGYGWGVTSKGLTDYEGVENMDITPGQEASVEKFETKLTADSEALVDNMAYKVGDLFAAIDGANINSSAVQVAVTAVNESGITAEYSADTSDWTQGTLTFNKIDGVCSVTIQDYNFCKPTTIILKDGKLHDLQKFNIVFPNVDTYLYRVGNMNEIALSSLFAEEGVVVDENVNVTITGVDGFTYTANSTEWEKGTIHFNNKTGLAKITIDEAGVGTTTLNVEVVDAVNATSATSATANNVVLLNNCGFSTLEVSNGYSLHGNGFTMTCSSDSYAVDRSYGFVTLNNGTLDNVQIIAPNFSHSILYDSNKKENGNPSYSNADGSRTWYYNIRSAVVMNGNSKITNSQVSGGRAAVYVANGNAVITNSTIKGGAAANIHVERSAAMTLKDITLIQKPTQANVNTTANTVMGLSVVLVCDSDGVGAPVTLEGYLHQYAWAHEDYKQYVPSDGQSLVTEALNQTDYIHSITYEDGVARDSVNLGFVYLPESALGTSYSNNLNDNRSDAEKNAIPYDTVTVNSSKVSIYTYKNTNGTDDGVQTEPDYSAGTQGNTLPTVIFNDTNDNRIFTTKYDNGWMSSLEVDVDAGEYTFDFANLLVQKHGKNLEYTVTTPDGVSVDTKQTILLNTSGQKEYILHFTDNLIYDQDGNLTGQTETYSYAFSILSTKTSISGPVWKNKPTPDVSVVKFIKKSMIYSSEWTIAIPVLWNAEITYWSKSANDYVDLALTTLTPTNTGMQADGANAWTVKTEDYTLTITSTVFKTNYAGMPVVYQDNGTNTLYYTVNSSSGCLGSGTSSRSVTFTYTFTDSNNNALQDNTVTWNVNKDSLGTSIYYDTFVEGGDSSSSGDGCFAEGTMITLADGSQKPIEQITQEDQLLAWDFHTGTYVATTASLIESGEAGEYRVINLKFADGTVVRVIDDHGFFDVEENNFVFIDEENVGSYVGHQFVRVGENGTYENVELAGYEITVENVRYYTIQTVIYNNCIAEGMFTLTPPPEMLENDGWFDYFEIGEGMKYDEEKMQADIEKYGLYTYEEFAEYATYEQFVAFNGPYLKVLVGRGVLTYEQILEILEMYKQWMT